MTYIIIPIKKLTSAKQRLAPVLSPAQRVGLVLAMLEDVLIAVVNSDNGSHQKKIYVVASDDAVFDVARKFSVRMIREHPVQGYNSAVNLGFSAVPSGCDVAVVPGDVPLAKSTEITVLTKRSQQHSPTIRLAAARDNRGTNGLFLSAKDLIQPNFGVNSFPGYHAAARSIGVDPELLDAPCLAHDIDTPTDLSDFSQRSTKGATRKFLRLLK